MIKTIKLEMRVIKRIQMKIKIEEPEEDRGTRIINNQYNGQTVAE